ncbi:hypothetical protein MBANPS3_008246 [Mucor bainieri]
MYVNIRYPEGKSGFVKPMSLAFTPTMKSFIGQAEFKRFFDRLVEVAANSGAAAFRNLKSLPYSIRDRRLQYTYKTALLTFRDTLESVRLTKVQSLVNTLPTFKNLKKLYTSKQELSIDWTDNNNSGPFDKRNIQQIRTMKTLQIYKQSSPELLYYLTHKYPNVNRMHIDMKKQELFYS